MPLKLSEAVYGSLLEKNYEKALTLGNRYSFINANILPVLNDEEKRVFLGFQEVCQKLVKEVDTEDVYPMVPKLGAEHMVQRMNTYEGVEGSCKHQLLLSLAVNGMAPEVDMAMTASGVLVGNSLYHNPKRTEIQEKALHEIYAGTKIGGIGITEMENGSDAVNMKMRAAINPDGSITYNGTKIYTTNGAVADYLSTYGVTDISDPRRTMMLTLFQRGDPGLTTERIHIPGAQGVGIGKCIYDNVTVPADRMLAPPGEGYKRLFRGLTPERIAIIAGCIAGEWHSLAYGVYFSQIRHQFGKPIFKNQGISFTLADLYSHLTAYTAFAFQIADFYDKKVGSVIHKGETPNAMDEGTVAIMAAQGKYLAAKYCYSLNYEIVQSMGGRGAISEPGSNNGINRGENISRIMEVIGGHRNVQLMIVESGLKATSAMAIDQYVKKAKKENTKSLEEIVGLTLGNAEKLLAKDGSFLGEETRGKLENVIKKLKNAIDQNNDIEMKAYGDALPRVLADAGKEAYKAKKAAQASSGAQSAVVE